MAKKRSNGDGAVYQLPSGTWRGQVMDGYRDDGKRNVVNFTGKTEGEVQEKIREYSERKMRAMGAFDKQMSFNAWADMWYEDYRNQVEESTYANYRYTLNALKEHFGERFIYGIKPLEINRFLESLKNRGLSQSYVTKCRSMLIQIFDAAEANEIVDYNPARRSRTVKFRNTSERTKDAFHDDELDFLKKGLQDDLMGHSIRLMLGTGIRTQELLALTAKDILQDGSQISVTKAVQMVDGLPKIGPPKSKRGKRVVPVPEDYRKDAIYLRTHGGKPLIWKSSRENGMYDVGAFRKKYYRAIKKIPGVRPLSPHCCRHTYISNLEKKGVPMEQIARLVGHSRVSTTDGYLHTDMGTLGEAVSVLNELRSVAK